MIYKQGFLTLSGVSFLVFQAYSVTVKLKICEQCKRPYLDAEEFCPKCPRPDYRQDSWIGLGCLLAMVAPLFLMTFLWLFFFFGIFLR